MNEEQALTQFCWLRGVWLGLPLPFLTKMERKVVRRPFISHEGANEPHGGNNSHTGRDLFSRSDRQWISTNDGDVGINKNKKKTYVCRAWWKKWYGCGFMRYTVFSGIALHRMLTDDSDLFYCVVSRLSLRQCGGLLSHLANCNKPWMRIQLQGVMSRLEWCGWTGPRLCERERGKNRKIKHQKNRRYLHRQSTMQSDGNGR